MATSATETRLQKENQKLKAMVLDSKIKTLYPKTSAEQRKSITSKLGISASDVIRSPDSLLEANLLTLEKEVPIYFLDTSKPAVGVAGDGALATPRAFDKNNREILNKAHHTPAISDYAEKLQHMASTGDMKSYTAMRKQGETAWNASNQQAIVVQLAMKDATKEEFLAIQASNPETLSRRCAEAAQANDMHTYAELRAEMKANAAT